MYLDLRKSRQKYVKYQLNVSKLKYKRSLYLEKKIHSCQRGGETPAGNYGLVILVNLVI